MIIDVNEEQLVSIAKKGRGVINVFIKEFTQPQICITINRQESTGSWLFETQFCERIKLSISSEEDNHYKLLAALLKAHEYTKELKLCSEKFEKIYKGY